MLTLNFVHVRFHNIRQTRIMKVIEREPSIWDGKFSNLQQASFLDLE